MSVNRKEYMINMSCDIKKRIVLIVLAVTVSVAAACFISQQNVYAADKGTYLIKVNTKKNVVTAYKKSIINGKKKYVPISERISNYLTTTTYVPAEDRIFTEGEEVL